MASPVRNLAQKYCRRMSTDSVRSFSISSKTSGQTQPTSPSSTATTNSGSRPRHFLSIADLTSAELTLLVRNAARHKHAIRQSLTKLQPAGLDEALKGKTVAMMFSKRSTRTRISTESAVAALGGHPMFLGKDDIQLGVNESLVDTSIVVSSMVNCIVARVGAHSDVAGLAKHSSVPVINALSDLFHPLQTLADILTMHETFASPLSVATASSPTAVGLGIQGLKAAWVGDSNNVLIDLAIGCQKTGVHLTVASPKGYSVPEPIQELINTARKTSAIPGSFTMTESPLEAVADADVIFTDTWVSMGQEQESAKRLADFEGFRVTDDLARKGGAKKDWKLMHCLPRHQEEVDDAVFYGNRSLVWTEAENRLWAMIAALEGFVVNKGHIQ